MYMYHNSNKCYGCNCRKDAIINELHKFQESNFPSTIYCAYLSIHVSVLDSSYGTPLAQRASYLTLHSSFFGPVVQLIMIILSLTALTEA